MDTVLDLSREPIRVTGMQCQLDSVFLKDRSRLSCHLRKRGERGREREGEREGERDRGDRERQRETEI